MIRPLSPALLATLLVTLLVACSSGDKEPVEAVHLTPAPVAGGPKVTLRLSGADPAKATSEAETRCAASNRKAELLTTEAQQGVPVMVFECR